MLCSILKPITIPHPHYHCEDSLKSAPLLQVSGRLCGDEADQLLHAVVLGEEEE